MKYLALCLSFLIVASMLSSTVLAASPLDWFWNGVNWITGGAKSAVSKIPSINIGNPLSGGNSPLSVITPTFTSASGTGRPYLSAATITDVGAKYISYTCLADNCQVQFTMQCSGNTYDYQYCYGPTLAINSQPSCTSNYGGAYHQGGSWTQTLGPYPMKNGDVAWACIGASDAGGSTYEAGKVISYFFTYTETMNNCPYDSTSGAVQPQISNVTLFPNAASGNNPNYNACPAGAAYCTQCPSGYNYCKATCTVGGQTVFSGYLDGGQNSVHYPASGYNNIPIQQSCNGGTYSIIAYSCPAATCGDGICSSTESWNGANSTTECSTAKQYNGHYGDCAPPACGGQGTCGTQGATQSCLATGGGSGIQQCNAGCWGTCVSCPSSNSADLNSYCKKYTPNYLTGTCDIAFQPAGTSNGACSGSAGSCKSYQCDGQGTCASANQVGSCCGNSVCEAGENNANCPNDCPAKCPNGILEGSEQCESNTAARTCYTTDGKQGTENCNTNTCVWSGVCNSNWVCVNGQTQSCGLGGIQLCGPPDATNGQWGTCKNQGVCANGATKTQSCGNCGSQTSTCVANQWGAWGTCTGQGICSPNAIDNTCTVGGIPGQATCNSDCYWGACQQIGTCVPGTTQTCGNCGTKTCDSTGKWGTCNSQGTCTPGATNTITSSQGCQHTVTCNAQCAWGTAPVDSCLKGTSQGCTPSLFSMFSTQPGSQVCQDDCSWSTCTYTSDALIVSLDKTNYTTTDAVNALVKTGLAEGQSIEGVLSCTNCGTTITDKQTAYVYTNGNAKSTTFTFSSKPKGAYTLNVCYPTCANPSLSKSASFTVQPVFQIFEITGEDSQTNNGPILFSVRITDDTGKGLSQSRGEVELTVIPTKSDGTIAQGTLNVQDNRDGTYDYSFTTTLSEPVTFTITATSTKYGIATLTKTKTITIGGAQIFIDTSMIPATVASGATQDLTIKTETPDVTRTPVDADYIKVWIVGPAGNTVKTYYMQDLAHPSTGTYTIYGYKFSASSADVELWSIYVQADALSKNLESNKLDGLGISVNPCGLSAACNIVTPPCQTDSQCGTGFVCRATQCVSCTGIACSGIDYYTIGAGAIILIIVLAVIFLL